MGDLPEGDYVVWIPFEGELTTWMCNLPGWLATSAPWKRWGQGGFHPRLVRIYSLQHLNFPQPLPGRTFVLNYAHPLRQTYP